MSPRHDPHATTAEERRRIRLWQWIARFCLLAAVAGAGLAAYYPF